MRFVPHRTLQIVGGLLHDARNLHRLSCLAACLFLAACAGGGGQKVAGRQMPETAPFSPEQLAKTDIDRVADAHRKEAFASLRLLTEKLYRRNPREWKQAGRPSLDDALARIFDDPRDWRFPELEDKRGADALHLAFLEDFRGDRVLALSVGLGSMLDTAFNGKAAFFILDDLDAQKLYNCARNVEIAAWKLNHDRDALGAPILLANEGGAGGNLSFEREFGKLIGNLDLLSGIVADKSNRSVVRIVQGLATAVFLPLR
ncbi:MAG: hypothetical protein PHU46_13015 [Rhodocyclaceae bacterium]|nr:hypothetical protein [Rhodocyclaceae bacterium]